MPLIQNIVKNVLPALAISDEALPALIEREYTENTLIICDPYNYPEFGRYVRKALVTSCSQNVIKEIVRTYSYDKILAVGGCTVLDIARACAGHAALICFPTILSTTCISCNRSKIQFTNGYRLIKTKQPLKTIISIPYLLQSKEEDLIKWTQSGFGDLFANISASIDLQYQQRDLEIHKIRGNVIESFKALDWVVDAFNGYDEKCLKTLARYLHHSSIEVIKRNNTKLSSGSEHLLYHTIIKKNRPAVSATHGQIVGIGTLITAKVFSTLTGDDTLFDSLKESFHQLQLPANFGQLRQIGIGKDAIIESLQAIPAKSGILGDYFSNASSFDILDSIFGI